MSTLIINDPAVIFLHIPKAAGTSVSKWLIKNTNAADKTYVRHPLLSTVYKDLPTPHPYHIITTVRNPWARTVSGYQNFLRHYHADRKDMMKDVIIEIKQITSTLPDINQWIALLPHTTAMVGDDWSLRTPQTAWITPGVDLVIKTENLATDFKIIQEIFKNDEPLGVLNKSELTLDYRVVLNDTSRKIISKLYESDIDTWKYVF